ncbi:ankyrin repeat-containing protein [Tanacetum coccineum]
MTGKHSAGPISVFTLGSFNIIQSSNNYATQLASSAGASEFDETYNNTPGPSFLDGSPGVLTNSNGASRSSLTERIDEIDSSPELQIDEALKRIQKQLSLEHVKENGTFYNENEYPDDLGFTYNEQNYSGFEEFQYGSDNSVSLQYSVLDIDQDQINTSRNGATHFERLHQYQQTLKDDSTEVLLSQQQRDPVEEQGKHHSGDTGTSYDSSILPSQELEDSMFPTYIPTRNMYQNDADRLEPHSLQNQVLIVGTFTCDPLNNEWICMFGDTEVPVEIIQEISCHAPPPTPGKVTICITSGNREACSEVREFEYHDKPHMHMHNTSTENEISRRSEELRLLVRFVQTLLSDKIGQKGKSNGPDYVESSIASEDSWNQIIEALTDDIPASSRTTDWLLEELLKDKLETWLSSKLQDNNTLLALSKGEQGIIY